MNLHIFHFSNDFQLKAQTFAVSDPLKCKGYVKFYYIVFGLSSDNELNVIMEKKSPS